MLKLTNIRKSYKTYDFTQVALDDVSVSFRDNEFAAILGSSGSGKTTMLNIIGGLDHYDSGDLEIDGISTKKYKSSDWDTYRNNRIGFVFQSYNLIPHQSVLANVELALTLSGVSSSERKERAKKALEEVGLADHIRKLPSQLSGGQMQRVAIARALINDPEILLADEPTGALDTKTSVQVMELLTQIAKNRLVIMVTHNPALADEYANRIIELKDGQVINDSNPFDPDKEKLVPQKSPRKVSMSFFTAISLSLSNLMTKKGRTFVTSLAGSIGIIGIAAILALASGINAYIGSIEEETMSVYPLTIQSSGVDITSFLVDSDDVNSTGSDNAKATEDGDVGVRNVFERMFNYQNQNDLASLKTYIEKNEKDISPYVKNIQYKYDITPQIYLKDTSSIEQVSPDSILSSYGIGTSTGISAIMGNSSMMSMNNFHELPGDSSMFENQYDIKAGRWPESYDEAVLVLMGNGDVSDYVLYSLGLKDRGELKEMLDTFVNNPGKTVEIKEGDTEVTYDDIMGAELKVINPADKYVYDEGYKIWMDKSDSNDHMKSVINDGVDLKIVGVVQADPDATATSLSSGINYTPEMIQYLMEESSETEIVKEQLANPTINVFTGKSFAEEKEESAQSDFSFTDLFTIDENAIRNAFNVDTSQFNIDMSSFNIDMSSVEFPQMDLTGLNEAVSGQINIPADQLNMIMMNVMQDFVTEQIQAGVTDPAVMAQNLVDYLNRADVQQSIAAQLGSVIDPTQISDQLNSAIQSYMQTAMQTYMTEIMTSLQTQIQTQIQTTLAQLPQQMQNAISIDQEAFASAFQLNVSEDDILDLMTAMMNPTETTLETNLSSLGYADSTNPNQISVYPKDFTTKENVIGFLDDYNEKMEKAGDDDKVVRYSDIVGTMMSSVTDIVDTISYALIAFVAISLVVSSIMIGVITYISVLERKKEIGILRAIGASKRDIRRVFNAETLIIGFIAGVLGIFVTYLLSIVANIIVYNELGIANIAQLPIDASAILIIISMLLAFISGLFPSSAAARKDPVEALRSE
ncbi:ABC transporter ATP-binding protein/permease [Breznakia pachnodae]|uniref:ABC-type lipoprotein export system ATPase subunit/ABC-type lipoprotein release transport system permease subunit n=1 Tax=Breznakia pachnodae TaxID=265178 RepID=A0ABU0E0E5_9FIRM|nr:ABC transporter ATP-binding protein/permease [Breznakia pachnodae]MDQ0360340.1 ABC-type lipoprotein export system ATPase subunit/ABC-type lipoprotein release transport system permease subunit [Breznakia pachnodae]